MFQRVWSNLGSSAVKSEQQDRNAAESVTTEATEATDRVSDPTSRSASLDLTGTLVHLPWMYDNRPSGSTRHSRASSIVSTRTKYSTLSIPDDARSIDIHVGGQTFRIARDGSRVTDAPPPPYSGPVESNLLRDGRPRASSQSSTGRRDLGDPRSNGLSYRGGRSAISPPFDHYYGEHEDDQTDHGAETPRQHSRAPSPRPTSRAEILTPSESDMLPSVDAESQTLSVPSESGDIPSRNWSYKEGPDIITVAPEARKLRSVSQNDLPILSSCLNSPLIRRNGVRLPALITESLDNAQRPGSSTDLVFSKGKAARSPMATRSAGPVLYGGHHDVTPQSPTYIGKDARGTFPTTRKQLKPSFSITVIPDTSASEVHHNLDCADESALPLPMDNENDISLHYTRMMRKLDRDHRKALHLKDKELERFRDRLNEMDVVYRQEIKFRDFVIDDLKKRLDHLQEESEMMVEQARNEVEELWEGRWKIQSSKLTERMKRVEEDAHTTIKRLITERDPEG